MGKEILAIPEEYIEEVIVVIRAGLVAKDRPSITQDTYDNLKKWCDEHEVYHAKLQ